MVKFVFNKYKYLNYNRMTEATMPKHLKRFLEECDGQEIDLSHFTFNENWGFNVFDVKGTNWAILTIRLSVYCDIYNN